MCSFYTKVAPQKICVEIPGGPLSIGQHVLHMAFCGSIGLHRTDGIYACSWEGGGCAGAPVSHNQRQNHDHMNDGEEAEDQEEEEDSTAWYVH